MSAAPCSATASIAPCAADRWRRATCSCLRPSSRWSYSFNDSPVPNKDGSASSGTRPWSTTARWSPGSAVAARRVLTACGSIVLGTWRLRARQATGASPPRSVLGMVNAPLVMPEVIIGLSLLLMLVSVQRVFGWPSAALTIWFGHVLAGHGLRDGGRAGASARPETRSFRGSESDGSRRAAWQVFTLVTPADDLAVAGRPGLNLTLIDDVVLSAFLSGPGATTMPLVIFSRAPPGSGT